MTDTQPLTAESLDLVSELAVWIERADGSYLDRTDLRYRLAAIEAACFSAGEKQGRAENAAEVKRLRGSLKWALDTLQQLRFDIESYPPYQKARAALVDVPDEGGSTK
jgi:hypothetical protein